MFSGFCEVRVLSSELNGCLQQGKHPAPPQVVLSGILAGIQELSRYLIAVALKSQGIASCK